MWGLNLVIWGQGVNGPWRGALLQVAKRGIQGKVERNQVKGDTAPKSEMNYYFLGYALTLLLIYDLNRAMADPAKPYRVKDGTMM